MINFVIYHNYGKPYFLELSRLFWSSIRYETFLIVRLQWSYYDTICYFSLERS